ncbi:DUF4357 domain-containing protein [Nitratifractor sp.]
MNRKTNPKTIKLFLLDGVPFYSPSAAASLVMGRSANGLTEWKS